MSNQTHLTEDDLIDLPRGAWVRDSADRDWRKIARFLWELDGTLVHETTRGLARKGGAITLGSDGN